MKGEERNWLLLNQQRSLSIANGKQPLMISGQKEDAARKTDMTDTTDNDTATSPKASPYSISTTTTTTIDADSDDTNHTYSKPTANFSQWSLHNDETTQLDQQFNVQNQTNRTGLLPAEAPSTTWYSSSVVGLWGVLIVALLGATTVKKYRAQKRDQYQEIVNTSLVV